MEAMVEILKYFGTTAIGGGVGLLFSKMKTRRERKATDLELLEKAIAPLLTSISELTTHNGQITERLVAEQTKSLQLLQENAALIEEKMHLASKVESLEKEVKRLANVVKRLANEKGSAVALD